MLQKCRKMLKNEKGLTLIELLAVVVILGIIAAIAIPSIGSIISKSKEDSYEATAQQIMSGARLAIANGDLVPSSTNTEESHEASTFSEYVEYNSEYTDVLVYTAEGKITKVTFKVNSKEKSYDAIK